MVDYQELKARYPQLVKLFGAYVHQDYDIYGSADAAVDAYATEAPEQKLVAASELSTVLHEYPSDDALRNLLYDLDAGYDFEADGFTARSWLEHVRQRLEDTRSL